MKRNFTVLLFSFIGLTIVAQDIHKTTDLSFYGIDYTKVVICAADEPTYDFIDKFKSINNLLAEEHEKYNLYNFLIKERIELLDINDTNYNIKRLNVYDASYTDDYLNKDTIALMLKDYPDAKFDLGAALIAGKLDKANKGAYYTMVYFNTKTKKIIQSYYIRSYPRGFGLRNYWAGSVLSALNIHKKILSKEIKQANKK